MAGQAAFQFPVHGPECAGRTWGSDPLTQACLDDDQRGLSNRNGYNETRSERHEELTDDHGSKGSQYQNSGSKCAFQTTVAPSWRQEAEIKIKWQRNKRSQRGGDNGPNRAECPVFCSSCSVSDLQDSDSSKDEHGELLPTKPALLI